MKSLLSITIFSLGCLLFAAEASAQFREQFQTTLRSQASEPVEYAEEEYSDDELELLALFTQSSSDDGEDLTECLKRYRQCKSRVRSTNAEFALATRMIKRKYCAARFALCLGTDVLNDSLDYLDSHF